MSHDPAGEIVLLDGRTLKCPFCGGERFHHRESVMSTRKLAFFDLEWMGKKAQNYVCAACGYIYWFMREDMD